MTSPSTSALVREAREQAEKERLRASLLPEDWQLRGVVEDTASLLDRLATALTNAHEAVEAEREACAVIVRSAFDETTEPPTNDEWALILRIENAIRARAQQEAGEAE